MLAPAGYRSGCRRLELFGGPVDDMSMRLIHDDPNDPATGDWVRFAIGGSALGEGGYWPGPHRPGQGIYSTDHGDFGFDHRGPDAVIYSQTATS